MTSSTKVEDLSLSRMWKSPTSVEKSSDLTECHASKHENLAKIAAITEFTGW